MSLKISTLVLVLINLLTSCSELDASLQQGAGEGDEPDLEVAEPVPMWLVAEDTTLREHSTNLKRSGANGSIAQSQDSSLNPMNTARWREPTPEQKKSVLTCSAADQQTYHDLTIAAQTTSDEIAILPVNFGASISLITLPGLATGELLDLLRVQASLIGVLSDVFKERTFSTRHSVRRFDLGENVQIGQYRFIEVVVVVPARESDTQLGQYRINYYIKDGEDNYTLATYIEFSPLSEDPQKAKIRLVHGYKTPLGESSNHLILDYDTKSRVVKAVVGSKPDIIKGPNETHLELVLLDNLYAIFGAVRYNKNDNMNLASQSGQPRYYSPETGDVLYFRALQDLAGSKKSVQDLAFNRADIDIAPFGKDWSSYSSTMSTLLLDYIVALMRGGSNGSCHEEMDNIRAHQDYTNKSIPEVIASAPANICATNTAITDESVKSWLLTACRTVRLNKCFNLSVEGVDQSAYVGICRKIAEALLLNNAHQRIVVEEINNENSVRLLDFGYGSDATLINNLLAAPKEDEEYEGLESYLGTLVMPEFSAIGSLQWDDQTSQVLDYFKDSSLINTRQSIRLY